MISVCKHCHATFDDLRAKSRRTPWCSPECAAGALRSALVEGDPVVELSDAGVWCCLCEKLFECAGTHFVRVHHMDTGDSRSERQLAYGLPQGTRLASARLRSLQRDNAIEAGFGRMGSAMNLGRVPVPAKKSIVSVRSTAQLRQLESFADSARNGTGVLARGMREWNAIQHSEALVDWHCATCGKSEQRTKSKARHRYCSLRCRPTTEETADRLRAHAAHEHKIAVIRRTIICIVCGNPFVPSSKGEKGRRVKHCSFKCVAAGRRLLHAKEED